MLQRPRDRVAIENAEILRGKSAEVRAAILRAAQVDQAGKNEILFHEGDSAQAFFILLSGWVSIYRLGKDGRRAELGLFGPGESFAEATRAMDAYPANAQAMTAVRFARIEWRAVEVDLHDGPALSLAIADSVAKHLGRLIQRTSDRSLLTVTERLARYLLERCPGAANRSEMRLPFTKSLLARDLGVSPETLSRAFAELSGAGVTIANRDIHVGDAAALRGVLGGDAMG